MQVVNLGAVDTDMIKGSHWDMPGPDSMAEIILDRVEADELEMTPDQIGLTMFNAWRDYPSNLARSI